MGLDVLSTLIQNLVGASPEGKSGPFQGNEEAS